MNEFVHLLGRTSEFPHSSPDTSGSSIGGRADVESASLFLPVRRLFLPLAEHIEGVATAAMAGDNHWTE